MGIAVSTKRLLGSLLAIGLATLAGIVALDVSDPPETFSIDTSYAFDVSDPRLVAGSAEFVFFGRVTGTGTPVLVDEWVHTDFQVAVEGQPLKGTLPLQVLVRQLGGTLGEDTWVLHDQPLLRAGETYLLVGGREPGQRALGLSAAPLNAHVITGPAERAAAVTLWTNAIRDQRDPF